MKSISMVQNHGLFVYIPATMAENELTINLNHTQTLMNREETYECR